MRAATRLLRGLKRHALCDLGRWQEAIGHYREAVAAAPDIADIWYNLANALAETDADGTEACYHTAIRLRADSAPTRGNYGRWLMTYWRWAEAEAQFQEAVRLAPMQAANWNNLGVVRRELCRPDVEACFRQALLLDPALADARYNLGCMLSSDGRTDEAIACHQAALTVDPGFGKARLAACMAQLPILYGSQNEITVRRQRYADALMNFPGLVSYWRRHRQFAAILPALPGQERQGAAGCLRPTGLPRPGGVSRTTRRPTGTRRADSRRHRQRLLLRPHAVQAVPGGVAVAARPHPVRGHRVSYRPGD